MDMISIIASIMLVLGCLYLILSPFTQKSSSVVKDEVKTTDDHVNKQELYATLNEIEMDYKMNKLSEEDYQKMKKSYELLVAEILRKETSLEGKNAVQKESIEYIQKIEDEIDAELEALRKERRIDS